LTIYRHRPDYYPFSGLVGQETMKDALILCAIGPGIGGVLIRGEKGTAKSTAVRALARLLPTISAVADCYYGCHPEKDAALCSQCRRKLSENGALKTEPRLRPFVDLPLNATEDMVLGGLDFSKAVKTGQKAVSPGLLGRAHRGFLYVDEVNLLDDHLVDIILDAAATGINVIEREGVSLTHPARFVLVGTMNPEEGELRPQLLDRFGLCVQVAGEGDLEKRLELMSRREDFDRNPDAFLERFDREESELAKKIVEAKSLAPRVRVSGPIRSFISELCRQNNVAGHRADLVIQRAAAAWAAFKGRTTVEDGDIAKVAPLALLHRRRDAVPPPPHKEEDQEQPQPPPPDDQPEPNQEKDHDDKKPDELDEPFDLPWPEPDLPTDDDQPNPPEDKNNDDERTDAMERIFEIGQTFKVRRLAPQKDRVLRRGSGRRSLTRTAQKQGRYVKSRLNGPTNDLALDATLRAAAPHQLKRRGSSTLAVVIRDQDIHHKVRERRVGNFLLFLVDASGSMGARSRMIAAKGAVMSLLMDAYQKRDKVAMIAFRGHEANVALSPTSSIELAARKLKDLPIGGRTPLAAGLVKAHEQLSIALRKDPDIRPIVLLITDGRTNTALNEGADPVREALAIAGHMGRDHRLTFVVVDSEEEGIVRLALADRLAAALGATCFKIENLKSEDLVKIARREEF
jgi:magnesium chelatase subunit D